MKKFKWVCISLMIIAFAMVFTACSGNEGASPQAKAKQEDAVQPAEKAMQSSEETDQSAQSPAPAPAAGIENPEVADQTPSGVLKTEVAEIMGTVLDTDGQIVVFTDKGNYAVTGEDLSDMVGKTVRVLGALQEAEGRQTIKVISFSEVK